MNSEQFIDQNPTITAKVAERIIKAQQLDTDTLAECYERFNPSIMVNKVDTADLLGWLGF